MSWLLYLESLSVLVSLIKVSKCPGLFIYTLYVFWLLYLESLNVLASLIKSVSFLASIFKVCKSPGFFN
jgi:hypothetical protein